jgi:hypothetical protein
MVALVKDDIPASINSVEKLAVWCDMVLQNLHPEMTVIEVSGSQDRAVLSAPYFISASNPPGWRVISRTSIAINSNWQRGGKLWTFALDLSGAAIPAEFKV